MTAQGERPRTSTIAVVGLVLAVISPVAGIIVSVIGIRDARRKGSRGRGLAIAGIVLSCVSLVGFVFLPWALISAYVLVSGGPTVLLMPPFEFYAAMFGALSLR